jgi:predicted amidohydrolase
MSKIDDPTAARLQLEIPQTETRIDDALIAVSSLMASIVTARRDATGVPATRGHATILRLAKAQVALVDVSGDILRVHGDLVDIGRETAGYDLHEECPKTSGEKVRHLSAVS